MTFKPLPRDRDGRYTERSRRRLIDLAVTRNITVHGHAAQIRTSKCDDGPGGSSFCYGFWAVIFVVDDPATKDTTTWANLDWLLRGEGLVELGDQFLFGKLKEA